MVKLRWVEDLVLFVYAWMNRSIVVGSRPFVFEDGHKG